LQPCSPSHEPLSYYISEMGDVFVEEHIAAPHVEDIGHEVSTSFSHEDKGSVTCNSFQNSDFDDVMVNLESVVFEEKPLYDDEMLDVCISSCDENEGNQVFEVSKKIFSLIAIVWGWIIGHALGIPSMTLMGMILGRKMLIMCLLDNHV
jgi:hypothetical protein